MTMQMKASEQYFLVVLCKVLLTFESVDETSCIFKINRKLYFSSVVFSFLHLVFGYYPVVELIKYNCYKTIIECVHYFCTQSHCI